MRVWKCVIASAGLTGALLLVSSTGADGASNLALPTPMASPSLPTTPQTPTPTPVCTTINGVLPTATPLTPPPPRTIIITREHVKVVRVPVVTERVQIVTTPVPGPTKTVYTEKFSPEQTKIIHDKIRAAVVKTSIWAVSIAILVALISLAIVYIYGYRLGEVKDAERFRNTIRS